MNPFGEAYYWSIYTNSAIMCPTWICHRSMLQRHSPLLVHMHLDWETEGWWRVHLTTAANDNFDTSKQVFYA